MRVVSLFSGAGGLDLGFIQAGHTIIWANDIYEDAVKTYRINIGQHITCSDIIDVKNESIPDCDIIVGGFPCQGFSVANTKRHINDSRNKLYLELLRVLKYKKPRFFLAENVKGLLSLGKGAIIKMILNDFSKIGYTVRYSLLNAADFGVPQTRERVIIVGERDDIPPKYEFPIKTHGKHGCHGIQPWRGIGEALKDIPDPDFYNTLFNHEYSKYKLRFNGYIGHRVIEPNKPAPTVTARGDDKGGVVVLHHPNNKRRMSCRELAIVQGFPLDFKFIGTKSSVYRQIANAVPPPLSKAIASMFFS